MYDGKSLRDELNIHMMPLSIMVDGVVYQMMIICQAKIYGHDG